MRAAMTPAVLLLLAAACQAGDEAERVTLGAPREDAGGGLPAAVQVQIDSANVAYRARDFEAALRHYQAATRVDPDEPTGWYGVAMASEALGRGTELARARERLAELAPQLEVGTHTMPGTGAHPSVGAPGGMPTGHPPVADTTR